MKKKIIFITLIILAILSILSIFIFYKLNHDIDDSKYILVENYINQTYGIKCNIVKSSFTNNEDGITGGLYMYSFMCKNKDNKYTITYTSYSDLTSETLFNLKISE